jgi:2-alkenal reductase
VTYRSKYLVLLGIVLLASVLLGKLAFNDRLISDSGDGLGTLERSIVLLFERVSPSVVQVSTITGTDASSSSITIGSGFVWDQAGNMVTNEHVIRNANVIFIWLASREMLNAEVVGASPEYDLAVLRLKQPNALPPPLSIGRSGNLKIGQFAFAIGSPFGLDQSLTMGAISALNRRLPTEKGAEIGDIIQTDAGIYPGNSGGPLLDSGGHLIGVNTISYNVTGSTSTVGFAIPVDLVSRIVPDLMRDQLSAPGSDRQTTVGTGK